MECPWERAIQLSVAGADPHESVDYLTKLSELLQPCVIEAPTLPVPFLPPAMGNGPPNGNRGDSNQRRRARPNNRFQQDSDDEEINQAQEHLADLNINPPLSTSRWSAEDVFIQVVTTLGEMLGKLAVQLAREHEWTQSAERFTSSGNLLNLALQYADMMYARITARAELGDDELGDIVERVRRNCEVVGIAAIHGNEKKEQFAHVAATRKRQLESKLNPQWQDRDAAKERMGERAWVQNPHPKGDYASRRAADERELRELEEAVSSVAAVNYENVRDRSEQLRNVA